MAAALAAVHRAVLAASRSPRIEESYAQLDSEMLLLLVHLRPGYLARLVVGDHRGYLREAQAEGERAVRRHIDHGTRQITPRGSAESPSPR